MEKFAVGDVILVLFPFSNLKGQKLRPALIVASAEFGNFILCQITSKPYSSQTAIEVTPADFAFGGLPIVSFVRPDKLFTADTAIMHKRAGSLISKKRNEILTHLRKMFTP